MESASTNSSVPANLTGDNFEFNDRLLLNIIGYTCMFVVGTIGNTIVCIMSYQQTIRPENKGRTNVHKMVLHLTLADLIVSYVVIPLEIGWRLSVQWYAGNFACKFLMFIRAFAFYLSSMTLVALSLDRCLAIAKPMASRTSNVKRRGQIMITSAWLISALCALPQTLVFRVLKHPQMDFYQCTTMQYFDNIHAEKIYNSLFLVVVYVVPLLVIVVTYANIILKVFRKSKGDLQTDDEVPPAPRLRFRSSIRRSNQTSDSSSRSRSRYRSSRNGQAINGSSSIVLRRNVASPTKSNVALKMSFFHVTTFVACWTPYLVISLWHIFDEQTVQNVSPIVQDILFLTAVLNSCLNPFVYGGFYIKKSQNTTRTGTAESYRLTAQKRATV